MSKFKTALYALVAASSALVVSSCKDFDFEGARANRDAEYYNNFVEKFGAYDPDHTWNDLKNYSAEITIPGDMGGIYTVAIYLGNPREMEQAGLVALKQNVYGGDVVTFKLDAPQGTETFYVAVFDNFGHCVVRAVDADSEGKVTFTYNGGSYDEASIAGTRASRPEANLWFDESRDDYNYERPAEITDAERRFVMNWFATHKKTATGEGLDVNEYFLINIGYGGHEYTAQYTQYGVWDSEGESVYNEETDSWDWVVTRWYERVDQQYDVTVSANEHMDFVYANLNEEGSEGYRDHSYNKNNNTGDMMLHVDSETKYGFGFHETYSNNDVFNYHSQNYWLHITGIADDGSTVDGWYVGFDYETATFGTHTVYHEDTDTWEYEVPYEQMHIYPDGYYDDRVEKIVPAKHNSTVTPPDPEEDGVNYIIAFEDLGGDDDFDFNDIVISVKHVAGQSTGTVQLLAAGGTLEAYVMHNGSELTGWSVNGSNVMRSEVHALFDVPVKTMVNTGAASLGNPNMSGSTKTDVIKATVDFAEDATITDHAKDFGIKVIKVNNDETVTEIEVKFPDPYGNVVPQAILIADPNWRWPTERTSILDAYPNFQYWVGNASTPWYNYTWQANPESTNVNEGNVIRIIW